MKTSGFKPFSNNIIYISVMDNNLEHNDWKDDAPHLARLPKVNPFAVPEQYFEGLSDKICAAVFVEDLKARAGFPESEVPEGYFEQLPDEISARITLDALQLPKQPGFTVPEGYFDRIQTSILDQVAQADAPEVKVRKLWPSKLTRYAAAACLALITGFAIYLNQDRITQPTEKVITTTAVNDDPMLWDIEEDLIMEQVGSEGSGFITNTSATSAELEDYIIDHYSQFEIAANL
jgi:hypothetical protein